MLQNYKWMANGEINVKNQCVISQLAFQLHIHMNWTATYPKHTDTHNRLVTLCPVQDYLGELVA